MRGASSPSRRYSDFVLSSVQKPAWSSLTGTAEPVAFSSLSHQLGESDRMTTSARYPPSVHVPSRTRRPSQGPQASREAVKLETGGHTMFTYTQLNFNGPVANKQYTPA
jgi:hypothetical protein